MNGKWIAIFKTGAWTDSGGHTREWTAADLRNIVARYNPSEQEAPLVIGHPKTNAPAYGWVQALKLDGDKLWAQVKNVVPEFAKMVKNRMFPKRSISLSPDLKLRHIGFLGAVAPAVSGLADVEFSEIESVKIEFSDTITQEGAIPPAQEEKHMSLKDKFKNAFNKAVDEIPETEFQGGNQPVTFSEAEVKAREAAAAHAAAEKAKAEAAAEFAERQKKERAERKAGEVKAYCERMIKEGNALPAWQKAGLAEFMAALDQEETIEFSSEKKESRLAWFKGFLEGLPKVIEFSETAGRDKNTGGGNATEKLLAMTKKKMAADKTLRFSQALNDVQAENPGLAAEYLKLARG